MEPLFKQQDASLIDRTVDMLSLSYRAAAVVGLVIFILVLGLQQISFSFASQMGADIVGLAVFVAAFSLLVRSRRRSEATHNFNRRQLEIVLEGAPIGLGVLDLERKVVYCNSEFARTYGFRQDEIRGITLPMPESQKKPWCDLVDELRKGKSFIDIPTLRERKDGTRFYASIWGAPIADISDKPFGLVAVISASKDNLDRPLERRSMELLVQGTFDFMCVADLGGHTLFVNEPGMRMTGMRANEMDSTSLTDFLALPDRQLIDAVLGRVREGGRLYGGEARLRHFRTGASIHTDCKLFVIEDPLTQTPASIALVARDLSQRKMTEAQLVHARQALTEMLHNRTLGVAFVNTKGQTIDSNEIFQNMLGYSADEVRQGPFSRFVHPDDLPTGRQLFLDLAEGKIEFYGTEKRLIDKQGQSFPAKMTVRLMRDNDGHPSHTISIIERLREGSNAYPPLGSSESHPRVIN